MPSGPRRAPILLLSAWTLFVWGTRIRNAVGDDDLGAVARVGTLALAGSFVVLAAGVLVALARQPGRVARLVRVLAVWTVGVWVVRGTAIALGDRSAAFVAVHLGLAVVSVGLAWAAVRAASGAGTGSPPVIAGR